jgi:hypothetical protein
MSCVMSTSSSKESSQNPFPRTLAAWSAYISLAPCLHPSPSPLHLTQSSPPPPLPPSSFGRFPAHKVVLAAGSPHFRAMFTKSFLESRAKEVELHEITANGFQVRQQQHQRTHMESNAHDLVEGRKDIEAERQGEDEGD